MTEHYVTSLTWSKRLKACGVEQKSEFWWFKYKGTNRKYHLDDHINDVSGIGMSVVAEKYSAYLTDELAGMLPNTLGVGEGLTITKYPKHWTIRYGVPERMLLPYKNIVFKDDSLPNALAAMVEYLKQKGLI